MEDLRPNLFGVVMLLLNLHFVTNRTRKEDQATGFVSMTPLRDLIGWEPLNDEAAPAMRIQKDRRYDAITMASSFDKRCDFGHGREFLGRGFCIGCPWTSCIAGVCPADSSGAGLHLDAWLLGLES